MPAEFPAFRRAFSASRPPLFPCGAGRVAVEMRFEQGCYNGSDCTWAFVLDETAGWGVLARSLRSSAHWTKGGVCQSSFSVGAAILAKASSEGVSRSSFLRWCSETSEGIERRVASLPSPQQQGFQSTLTISFTLRRHSTTLSIGITLHSYLLVPMGEKILGLSKSSFLAINAKGEKNIKPKAKGPHHQSKFSKMKL